MSRGRERGGEGRGQVLYGLRPVGEALRAGRRRVEEVWLLAGRADRLNRPDRAPAEITEAAARAGVPVRWKDRAHLTALAGSPDHQGAAARVGPLPLVELEALAPRPDAEGEAPGGLLLVLDGIVDPQNFGALCRSALSLGCRGLVFPKDRSAGPTPAAAKAAAGAMEWLPLARVTNLARALGQLKGWGYWVLGLTEEAESPLEEVVRVGPVAIVVGGEGGGLRRLVREECDHLVRLSTSPAFPTLNASVAGAIALYEVNLRRKLGGQVPGTIHKGND